MELLQSQTLLNTISFQVCSLTCDKQPAGRGLSISIDLTPVDAFIRPGHMDNDHVTCGFRLKGVVIFVEGSLQVGGIVPCIAVQSDISALFHREGRNPQDHWRICTRQSFIYDSQ